ALPFGIAGERMGGRPLVECPPTPVLEGGDPLKRRASMVLTAALLTALAVAVMAPAGASARTSGLSPDKQALIKYLRTHGYLPLKGADTLARAKAHAAATIAARTGKSVAPVAGGANPVIGASWQGLNNVGVSPPDTNGAIGPNSYVEIINQNIGIYNRSGGLVASALL